jgi:ABC-type dipeptide/oligopeptide/nickel transport system permease subunit
LIPAGLLMMTGVAFAMVGLSLERVLDPRLRER